MYLSYYCLFLCFLFLNELVLLLLCLAAKKLQKRTIVFYFTCGHKTGRRAGDHHDENRRPSPPRKHTRRTHPAFLSSPTETISDRDVLRDPSPPTLPPLCWSILHITQLSPVIHPPHPPSVTRSISIPSDRLHNHTPPIDPSTLPGTTSERRVTVP